MSDRCELCAENKAFTFRTVFSCLVIWGGVWDCGVKAETGFLNVALGGLELTMETRLKDPPASDVLGLKACALTPS